MTPHPTQEASFTQMLWAQIQPLFNKILSHPFIRGLTDATLPPESFQFYIIQDALYLREFARALSIAAAKAPTNLAYTSYLLSVAYARPFHELLTTVLPCYWIYWEVGKALRTKGSQKHLYQRWINMYGGEEFGKVVQAVLALTDQIAPGLRASEREAMTHHFITTSRYEWMFWEMGYQQEQWPVMW